MARSLPVSCFCGSDPLERMTAYIEEGADVQCMAAKYIGASQSTGLAIGTTAFVGKMFAQNFIGFETPHQQGGFGTGVGEHRQGYEPSDDSWFVRAVGRPSKIDRQEIVGAFAAIKEWVVTIDHPTRISEFHRRSLLIAEGLRAVPGVLSVRVEDKTEGHDPHPLTIEVDPAVLPVTTLIAQLKDPTGVVTGIPAAPEEATALWVRRPLTAGVGEDTVRGVLYCRALALRYSYGSHVTYSAFCVRGVVQLSISMFGLLPEEEHVVVGLISARLRAAASAVQEQVEVVSATARL